MKLRGVVKGVYDASRVVYVYVKLAVPKELRSMLEDKLISGRPVNVEVKETLRPLALRGGGLGGGCWA